MRRTFAEVLKEGKIDIKNEYSKFYLLFYGKDKRDGQSIADHVGHNILNYFFRGTCLTLDEFNDVNNFRFEKEPQDFDEDYLISFMEYMYNFIVHLNDENFFSTNAKGFYIEQILRVAEKMGYMTVSEKGLVIFVPKDNTVMVVTESEQIPDNLSYKVLEYKHHSMKGNIEAKRDTLIKLADILEPKRKTLESINNSFTSDLFFLFNKCQIRHNNTDKTSKSYYVDYIAEMEQYELERVYDEIYRMCLLSFMQLEHLERKEWLSEIKSCIEKKK